MPELPEVETIRRGLAERLSRQTITGVRVRQAQLRHLVDVAALQKLAVGQTITSSVYGCHSLLLHIGYHVGVDIQREPDVAMS